MFPRARWRFLFGLFVVASLLLRAHADEIWRLDNLRAVGGHPPRVVGTPRVETLHGIAGMVFDGAHDGIFVPAIPFAGAEAFTIEVLISPADDGPKVQRFFHAEDSAGRRALIEIRADHKGHWWLDTFLRTGSDPADKGLALIDPRRVHPTEHWYWVALRYDGYRMADFVNGVKEGEGEREFKPFGDGKISIGVRQNLMYWFKGAIAEVRFYRKAVPEEKLQRGAE